MLLLSSADIFQKSKLAFSKKILSGILNTIILSNSLDQEQAGYSVRSKDKLFALVPNKISVLIWMQTAAKVISRRNKLTPLRKESKC